MNGGSGHCLCGAVRYRFEGEPNWQAHCHCASCRRATSSPFTSFFAVNHDRLHWSGETPARYQSSPGIFRSFCPHCGSPLAYQSNERATEIDLYALTLDDPSAFAATVHVHWNEHLPWLHLNDGLPRHSTPRRMTAQDDFGPLLSLITEAFAYMDGRIDPPSSANRLTAADLAEQSARDEIWVIEDTGKPVACMILAPRDDHLYLGKLAVSKEFRGQKLAGQLVHHAVARAKALNLPAITLQTRVELVENHAAFRAMGFEKTGETAHPGFDRATSFTFTLPVR